jgi:hypothetical protein
VRLTTFGVSHDTINRYLRTEFLNSEDLWRNVKEEFVSDTEAYLIFDDTVINNNRTYAKTLYIAHDNFDELHYSHVR